MKKFQTLLPMGKALFIVVLVISVLIMATAFMSGCSNSSSDDSSEDPSDGASPKAGDKLTMGYNYEGTTIHEITYKVWQIDDNGDLTEYQSGDRYLTLFDEEKFHDEKFKKDIMESKWHRELTSLTPDYMENFLKFEWHDYADKRGFSSRSVDEFLGLLRNDCNGEINSFFSLLDNSVMPLDRYVEILKELRAFYGNDTTGLMMFTILLDLMKINLDQFDTLLTENNITLTQFLEKLTSLNYGIRDLIDDYISNEWQSNSEFISHIMNKNVATKESAGIAIANMVWDIIKNGVPVTQVQGAVTSVLSAKDTDTINYTGGTDIETPVHETWVKNLFGCKLTSVIFKGKGVNQATNKGFYGSWIPNLYVDFTECFAGFTWSIDGSATVTNVVNTGGDYTDAANPPNPRVDVIIRISQHGWFQNFTYSYTMRALGKGTWTLTPN